MHRGRNQVLPCWSYIYGFRTILLAFREGDSGVPRVYRRSTVARTAPSQRLGATHSALPLIKVEPAPVVLVGPSECSV
ncbi:hypothetical protein N7478_007977 [Penicillium angulare]|uniref:uncharacterized protein n=1 Tax=Penicillium angulare TaxID=116970 RepID=UPI0025403BA3|nr:uncharacterized protein N7478_007977 [Penicillium angulare]KAJ5272852.1 hypothetical protein N7478_007977 [Penicillium angulare]